MPRGGRRPGAGRKPANTSKLSNFSTRITRELRSALEREAAHNGQSLSREIERRLEDSIKNEKTRKWGPPHVEAVLLFLVQLIESVESETGQRWIDDPFTFQAVYSGINRTLSMLMPDGDVVQPDRIKAAFKGSRTGEKKRAAVLNRSLEEVRAQTEWRATPEGVGEPAARGLWTALRMGPEDPGRDPRRKHDPMVWLQKYIRDRLEVGPWKNRNVHPYRKHDNKS